MRHWRIWDRFGWPALRNLALSRSLRWRLTAWYICLLSGLLLVFCAGTYIAVYRVLVENFDEILASQANLIVQTIDVADPDLRFNNSGLRIGKLNDEHLIRVYRADGKLIYNDNPEERSRELEAAVPEALGGERYASQIEGREGPMRVQTFPITSGGKVRGVLQVGLSLEDVSDTMRALLKVMLVLTPAMLLLALGGGLFLANRALQPIERITRAAQQISAENFSRRLDLRGPDDEVGRLARTFDAMIGRLQAAFEQQRRFAADASHELRTPLAAIIGQIDVATERARDAESYHNTLLNVRDQTQRLARLSNDLLFLARSDTQAQPALAEPLDLSDLLPAIVAQIQPLAQTRGQTIDFRPEGALPMRGNEDDLIRLFLNLLDNAIRYTPEGGRISIACRLQRDSLSVSVSDTGPGIAPEHLPYVFERFFRADRARNRAHGGSGLGLAIAQTIAQAHGGRIIVESRLGAGSTFTALLPAAR